MSKTAAASALTTNVKVQPVGGDVLNTKTSALAAARQPMTDVRHHMDEKRRLPLPPPSRPLETSKYMTRYEYVRLLIDRGQQLESGAEPCIDTHGMTDPQKIADAELHAKRFPFALPRILLNTNGETEMWDPNVMILPDDIC